MSNTITDIKQKKTLQTLNDLTEARYGLAVCPGRTGKSNVREHLLLPNVWAVLGPYG